MIFLTHAGWRELHNLVWLSVWVPLTYQGGEVTFTTNRWWLTHSDYSHCVTDCVFVLKDKRSQCLRHLSEGYRRVFGRHAVWTMVWMYCSGERIVDHLKIAWWNFHSTSYFCSTQCANTFFLTHFSWLYCMYKGLRHFSCRLQFH